MFNRFCRQTFIGLLGTAALLLLPTLAAAQLRQPKVKFEGLQVGFGSNKVVALFKSANWAPVYIYLKAGPDGTDTGGEITIESTDNDEVHTRYKVPFGALNPEEVATIQAYTKPGRTDFKLTAEMNHKIVATHEEDISSIKADQLIFLTVGTNIQSLRSALNPRSNAQDNDEDMVPQQDAHCQVASLSEVRNMPRVWFAYEPVDLLFLTFGNRDFVTSFLNEREGRKEALIEWVRRGGKLVVSVGKNQDMLRAQEIEGLTNLLPVTVTGAGQVPNLQSIERYAGKSDTPFATPRGGSFDIAKLEARPGRTIDTLLYWNQDKKEMPLVVRGGYGLGSVTVVAFDLDQTPFKGWKGQQSFLQRLVRETTPAFSNEWNEQNQKKVNWPNNQDAADLGSSLDKNVLQKFEEIPVISFGWVALFILIYILVVGPLDYFFLKKVVKRLELTWITFPTVVITISVAAYFTAYWLKGNDQKINKLDIVDIDLQTQQVYGNSLFTIFSPRIQHYTVGLEVVETDWAPAPPAGKPPWPVLVSWMGGQDYGFGGAGRGQSQGLFRRAYNYAPEAIGLEGVPIQVWSTKSFTTSWQAPFDPARPLVSADLKLPDRNKAYSGTITSRLPVALEDVFIYWPGGASGAWYSLGTLVPDTPKRVDGVFHDGKSMSEWQHVTFVPGNSPNPQIPHVDLGSETVKQLMFFNRTQHGALNLSFKELDQNWRLAHEQEAFIVGKIPRKEGFAEDISMSKESTTRIWLGSLPGSAAPRLPLNGTLAQETYVRIIIPVKGTKP